jgi:DNA replication protein DnaC
MACKTCNGIGAIRANGEVVHCPECYCSRCNGRRIIFGERGVSTCPCVAERRGMPDEMALAGIPKLYRNTSFDNFETGFPSCSRSQKKAKILAHGFAKDPTAGGGILFHGKVGLGKTHLAIAILRERINMGFSGRFYDGMSFVRMIQGAYGTPGRTPALMQPALTCDVLLLDDLGAFAITDDRQEIIGHVLNTRYNEQKTTIITTNFPFEGSLLATTDPEKVLDTKKEKTLGDRIGDRVVSRLQQMCLSVGIIGVDFRSTVAKARFGEGA